MKTILLTGSSGMVGKNILEHHGALEYKFLMPSSCELNLLNSVDVEKYLEKNRPDIVIHCAGVVGGIQANMKGPVRFLVENFEMGKNVLLATKKAGVDKILNMASSCMYPKDCQDFLEENMILTGSLEPTNEGYALAKTAVTKLGLYLNKESGTQKIKTLVPCNLFGRWDKFSENNSHMLPAVIRKIHLAIKNGETSVEVWGSGESRREFMSVSDLADFVFFALENWENIPEIINVGLGLDYSINEYYQAVAKVLGYKEAFHHDLSKPEGMKRKLVSTKMADTLGWKAKKKLEDGIREAYKFFLEKESL